MSIKPILAFIFLILVTSNCSANSDKILKHASEYLLSDQTERNRFHTKQDFDDLTGCPLLVKSSDWKYVEPRNLFKKGKMIWRKDVVWQYDNGILSYTNQAINSKGFTRPKSSRFIYVGPWKEIILKYGPFWNRKKIETKIRYAAVQKEDDIHEGHIYGSYEFKTPNNQSVKEQPIKLYSNLPTPKFRRLCEVKWIAKYGYNAIYDIKTGKVINLKQEEGFF